MTYKLEIYKLQILRTLISQISYNFYLKTLLCIKRQVSSAYTQKSVFGAWNF